MFKVFYCKNTAVIKLVVNEKDTMCGADNCNSIVLPISPTPLKQALVGRTVMDIDSMEYANSGFASTQDKITAIKKHRSALLKESDWTQLEDVPVELRNLWKEYRQKLRDIPSQDSFPENIEWPVSPEVYKDSLVLEETQNAN